MRFNVTSFPCPNRLLKRKNLQHTIEISSSRVGKVHRCLFIYTKLSDFSSRKIEIYPASRAVALKQPLHSFIPRRMSLICREDAGNESTSFQSKAKTEKPLDLQRCLIQLARTAVEGDADRERKIYLSRLIRYPDTGRKGLRQSRKKILRPIRKTQF